MVLNRHQILDRRSQTFACLIADKLEVCPELLEVAKSNLKRWIQEDEGTTVAAHQEWLDILNENSFHEILEILRSDSEEACRLRQSSPFAGLLTPQERWRILKLYDSQPA